MKLRFAESSVMKYAMAAISKIVDEASYKFTEEGFGLRAIDPSRIVLVDFFMPRESLLLYEVRGVESIGINMDDLVKVLRRSTRGDELELELLEAGKLAITFYGRGVRKFVIPSIEVASEEVPELSIKFTVRAKFPPAVFRDIVKELEPIGEAIEFITVSSENKVIAKSASDVAEVEIENSIESGSLVEIEAGEDARAMYTIDYLADIASAAPIADELIFEYGTDIPCKILFKLPRGGTLAFYVAPRIE